MTTYRYEFSGIYGRQRPPVETDAGDEAAARMALGRLPDGTVVDRVVAPGSGGVHVRVFAPTGTRRTTVKETS